MSNILNAIKAIIEDKTLSVVGSSNSTVQNRAVLMGMALEDYVKNAFAECLGKEEIEIKQSRNNVFSYLGNSNNPPDAMLKDGDAIEIKKLKTIKTSQLQLNSSYPKNKLYSNNPKISKACRECENWSEKDIIYVVGQTDNDHLHNIFFIYGDLYCDSPDIYENTENIIRKSVFEADDVNIADSQELGRVNKVDHLGISDLRIRGMWMIKSPFKLFNYLIKVPLDCTFTLVSIISNEKFYGFTNVNEFVKFCSDNCISVLDINIENPQNPAKSIASKLILYYR